MSQLAWSVIECRRCAGLFRLGRDVESALAMVDLFDEVQGLFQRAPEDARQQWADLLIRMLACQEAQDWLGLADSMEYELIDLLQAGQVYL